MEQAGSNFAWFMAYLVGGVVLLLGVVVWALALQHRKHQRERRATARASKARTKAWREGRPSPSKKVPLEPKK
jgi:CHASE1-domain containing sensor protein